MKRIIGLVIGGLAISGLLTAQTLNVQVGNVTYLFPASQAGSMPYESGTTLTVMGKSFTLSEIDNMYVDETAVRDSAVSVVYNGSSVAITVAGNIARYVTIAQSGTHVSIAQSSDLATEITYSLSGTSTNGEFYTSGEYKATLELNGLTLTNSTPRFISRQLQPLRLDGKFLAAIFIRAFPAAVRKIVPYAAPVCNIFKKLRKTIRLSKLQTIVPKALLIGFHRIGDRRCAGNGIHAQLIQLVVPVADLLQVIVQDAAAQKA